MNFNNSLTTTIPSTLLLAVVCTTAVDAAIVTPKMGGGQVMGSMIHSDVYFDGTHVSVITDESHGVPMLHPLTPPDEFDPAQAWSVLMGKAYNYQYAWNPGGFITLPTGGGIWVERLHHDEGLQSFLRPMMYNPGVHGSTWPEIFTSDGSRWKWSGGMQHNAYAVLNPIQSTYQARYRVYIGDATTGDPLPGYGSQEVIWTWSAAPIPEPASLATLALASILAFGRRRNRQ